ncbi:MAG: hypothetical protein QOF45_1576 [Gaiellaceae bacterium]|jgi:hypothetical protein|nr:hypothetical protein [Gaiellaceae bacterium]
MSNAVEGSKNEDKKKGIEISIDGEPYTATEKEMTADQILGLAGLDPAQNYLVKKEGRSQTSFKDKGSTLVKLHKHDEFISVPIGDTTVS